eukprot:gene19537-biopygen20164
MRRLWILLDLNDIDLSARCIRSEANEWAERLSRDGDDWCPNRRWFRWAEQEWHRRMVDHFASELSVQLPQYYAQWPDTGRSVLGDHISVSDGIISVVLHREKGRRRVRRKQRLVTPAARVQGLERYAEQRSYWRLPWERDKLQSAQANDWVQMALSKLGLVLPKGGYISGHNTHKCACTYARAVGTALERAVAVT